MNIKIPMTEEALSKILKNIEIAEPRDELIAMFKPSKQTTKTLRVKLGFDPTAPDLHLGHAVVLRKLKDFQDLGHKIVVIIGDYTARIGDPTGRNQARPPLTQQEIDSNAKTYLNQLGLILNLDKVEIVRNSEWFEKKGFIEAIALTAQFTLSQILQRQDFRSRYETKKPIFMHEILYPMMQAQDSVEVSADIEIGGADQVLNCLFGRDLQKSQHLKQQVVICMPLLPGTDGVEKMSKSKGNYIALTDIPPEMYGKIMSISDELLPLYLNLLTNFDEKIKLELLRELSDGLSNPMQIKKQIALDIVSQFHPPELALEAQKYFEQTVQRKDFGDVEIPSTNLGILPDTKLALVDLCVLAARINNAEVSRNEIKRLIKQGGVSIDNQKFVDPNQIIEPSENMAIKIGKRNVVKLTFQNIKLVDKGKVD